VSKTITPAVSWMERLAFLNLDVGLGRLSAAKTLFRAKEILADAIRELEAIHEKETSRLDAAHQLAHETTNESWSEQQEKIVELQTELDEIKDAIRNLPVCCPADLVDRLKEEYG
jgi:hypothetical protein